MAYATKDDMLVVWGETFLGDLLQDDVRPDEAVADALSRASGEMDMHLSARYKTPLSGKPSGLIQPCVNIGVYNLAIRHSALTETIIERYKQAIELMKRIAEGKAKLGADEPGVDTDDGTVSGGAAFYSDGRLFGRNRLP